MAIIAKSSSGTGDTFQPAPQGVHRAICCDVVDLGKVPTAWGEKHMVRLVWQLEALMQDGKPFMASKRYTLSLDERANLRHDLETWRGKSFTLTEAAGFDLERLLNVPCVVLIVHKPFTKDASKIFANVTAVLPRQPGAVLKVRDYVRVVERHGEQQKPVGPSYAPPPQDYVEPPPSDPFGPDGEVFEQPTADDIPF